MKQNPHGFIVVDDALAFAIAKLPNSTFKLFLVVSQDAK